MHTRMHTCMPSIPVRPSAFLNTCILVSINVSFIYMNSSMCTRSVGISGVSFVGGPINSGSIIPPLVCIKITFQSSNVIEECSV